MYIHFCTLPVCWVSDSPGMQLSAAVVVFAASLPNAVVRYPVGSLHTEHQVLDEGNLHTENTHQTQTVMGHRNGCNTDTDFQSCRYWTCFQTQHTVSHLHTKMVEVESESADFSSVLKVKIRQKLELHCNNYMTGDLADIDHNIQQHHGAACRPFYY